MRVFDISGSLRRGSHNTALLRHAGDLVEAEGAEFSIYDWRELPVYDEDLDVASPHVAVARIRAAVREADAVFFATPEYNSLVFVAIWAQAELRKVLGAAGARVVDGELALGHAMDRFDEDGRLNDQNLSHQLREVVRMLLAEVESGFPVRLEASGCVVAPSG